MTSSAVFVMPRGVDAWPTAEALWITARGWATAARNRLGAAWIATPDGWWEADRLPRPASQRSSRERTTPVPTALKTLLKDLRLWRSQSRFVVPVQGPWSTTDVALVWEHHDLFNCAGRLLADATASPLVRYVHAPQVWEASKWGVGRPLWGHALEQMEVRHLRDADLIACVSEQVRDRLRDMGLDPTRIVIAPMGVDGDRFSPEGESARERLGMSSTEVVMGWCGSFRRFHGLDRLIQAFAAASSDLPELRLLLVGDGETRRSLQSAVTRAGFAERVTFAGAVAHAEMPLYLRAMDITVVSSDGRGDFHYSPLKLREYAACGRPVVAPAEGELAALRRCGFVNVHEPGDDDGLVRLLKSLAGDPELRARQGIAARRFAVRHWTWKVQLQTVMDCVEGRRSVARP